MDCRSVDANCVSVPGRLLLQLQRPTEWILRASHLLCQAMHRKQQIPLPLQTLRRHSHAQRKRSFIVCPQPPTHQSTHPSTNPPTYTHTQMQTYTHTFTHTRIHTDIRAYTHIIYTCKHWRIATHTHVHTHAYMTQTSHTMLYKLRLSNPHIYTQI